MTGQSFVHAKRGSTPEERFWRNVDRRGDDECWHYGNYSHYGRIRLGGAGSKCIAAHRFSYLLAYGHCPDTLVVMHKCDNPKCVNPRHLLLGTPADNVADMMRKRREGGTFQPGHDPRRRIGEAHPVSKLTASDVLAIRADDRSHKDVAADYGVSPKLILNIKTRKAWKHV